jgi:predicted small secreted protein
MPARWIRRGPLALVLSAVATAACNSGSLTTPGAGNELTGDVGATIRDEVETTVSALTLSTSLTPIGTSRTPASSAPCVVSSTPADNDGDGVPDDATYIFTAPPCQFEGWRGGTLDLVGQLRLQDPAPTDAGFGYDATLTVLRTRYTNAAKDAIYDVERNGTRTLSGSVGGLLLTSDLQLMRTFVGKPDANIHEQWTVNYGPSTPLQINGPVNSGTLDISGTLNWTRGDEQLSLVITTPTPLEYDASCTDTVQRIRNGELHAAGDFGDNMVGFVRVRWNGCGQDPTVGFGVK